MSVLLKPYKIVPGRRGDSRFFLSDCRDVFRHLPAHSVDVIVTSPPYNLGIEYNRYEDSLSQADYLAWTGEWVAAAAPAHHPEGSPFPNVGGKPREPRGGRGRLGCPRRRPGCSWLGEPRRVSRGGRGRWGGPSGAPSVCLPHSETASL